MSSPSPRRLSWLVVLLIAVTGGFGWLLVRAQALPQGVVSVVWDKEACGQCRMHVGEPRFASQIQTTRGKVLNFDDPGCLFQWLEANPAPAHAIYFHALEGDRWIPSDEVAFVETTPTPMGYGLGAVSKTSTSAISFQAARERIRAGKGRSH
ncbi:MAG: hypothetical protein HYV07_08205 [Deltaproteobacteria bacterium]|nr:hypothetical protein [Deltaproteobacteria bacterium]